MPRKLACYLCYLPVETLNIGEKGLVHCPWWNVSIGASFSEAELENGSRALQPGFQGVCEKLSWWISAWPSGANTETTWMAEHPCSTMFKRGKMDHTSVLSVHVSIECSTEEGNPTPEVLLPLLFSWLSLATAAGGGGCKWQSGWKRDSPEELGLSHRLSSGRYGASHHSASRPAPGLFEFTGPVVLGQDVSLYGELTQDLDRIPSKVLNLIPAMLS